MEQPNHRVTHKNLHRTILELSLPGMVSSILQTMYQIIDAYWVGKLGAEALAAIGGSAFVLWAIFSLTALSVTGITTLVAQNIGAGKEHSARHAAVQGLLLATLIALLLAVTVYFLQDIFYGIMGFTPLVRQMAWDYMTIMATGMVIIFWFVSLEGVFRGLGDTRTPMIIVAVSLAFNSIADPVFIFGWFGFPALGVGGAALATVLAQFLSLILAVWLLRKKQFLAPRDYYLQARPDWPIAKRILDIGLPIALGGFFFSIIYVFLTNIISRFGTEAIAAIGVCHRIEGMAWFACVGFSVAATTLVGQFIGAGRIDEARRAAWWVNGYGVVTLLMVSIVFYFFPEFLMSIFTDDIQVRRIGAEYLRIIAYFEIFLALEVIMEGAFSGAGYTLPVMLVSVPITAARIPLAWYLALHLGMGTAGIWWAIAGTTFVKGLLNSILFALGLWKKRLHLAPVR